MTPFAVGYKPTEETRAKMRKPKSPEGRAAIAASNRLRAGRALSEEHRAKIGAAHRGMKRPPETGRKIGEANRRRKLSPESRAKIAASLRGRHLSEECRKKIGVANKGKKHSPETCARIAAAKRGARNPSWKGGIAHLPYAFSFTPALREEIRRRDAHKCQICGVPQIECDCTLHIHHADYNKSNSDPVNLVTLCSHCHARTSGNRRYWTLFFQKLLLDRMVGFQLPLPFLEDTCE